MLGEQRPLHFTVHNSITEPGICWLFAGIMSLLLQGKYNLLLKLMRFKINKLGAFRFLDCESVGYTFNTLSDFFSIATRPRSLFKNKSSKFLCFQEQRLYRETSNTIRSTITLQKLTTLVYKHTVLLLTSWSKLLRSDMVQQHESFHPRGNCISILHVEAIQKPGAHSQLSFFEIEGAGSIEIIEGCK